MSSPWRAPRAGLASHRPALGRGLAAPATAEEMPLPGPSVEGPVVQARRSGSAPGLSEKPLWELGIGVAGVRFPRLPRLRPVELLRPAAALHRLPRRVSARRQRRRPGDPVRRPAGDDRHQRLGVGADPQPAQRRARGHARPRGHLRDRSEPQRRALAVDRQAVEGRVPHAAAPGDHAREPSAQRRPHASRRTSTSTRASFIGGWKLGVLIGPLFGNQRQHQYFYGVDPEFATAGAAGLRRPRRLFRLARDRRALAPLRQALRRRLRSLRRPSRRGLRAQPAGPQRPRIHRRLRHVMDLRGIESARRGGRLTSADRLPAPGLGHRLLFALVIAQLGLVSLVWALVAPLLSLLLPRRTRERIGRSAISWIYRSGWATAERLGMMEVDSSALDPLRDEPGGLIVAGQPSGDVRRDGGRGAAAAWRLHHEGRAGAQRLPRRRGATGRVHPQRLRPRHGARIGRRA